MKNFLAFSVMAAAISGCASLPFGDTRHEYTAMPNASVVVFADQSTGTAAARSSGRNSHVRLTQALGDNLEEHGTLLQLVVFNASNRPLSLSLDNIRIDAAGKSFTPLSRSELAALEQKTGDSGSAVASLLETGSLLLGTLTAAAIGYNGGNSLSQGYIDQASESIGNGMAAGMEAGSKVREAQANASDSRLSLYDAIGLQTLTIPPRKAAGGYIIAPLPTALPGRQFTITVDIAGDRHVFEMQAVK